MGWIFEQFILAWPHWTIETFELFVCSSAEAINHSRQFLVIVLGEDNFPFHVDYYLAYEKNPSKFWDKDTNHIFRVEWV